MKYLAAIGVALFLTAASMAQSVLNMELVAHQDYAQNCNDIWGYVDEQGIEYAILGTVTGTAILSMEDPSSPREVLFIPGANSVWRDMKNWNHHVYVTTDQGADGLLVIDMSGAPDNISYNFWKPDLDIRGMVTTLRTCHNLYIDDKGYCYLAGCNVNDGGVIILDVHTNPGEPQYVSACDPRYSHDAMVRNDTLFSSEINDGVFSVIDVTDKSNPRTLVTQRTSFTFTHNAWVSDDGRYLFTTDEKPDAYIDAYDISDLDNIRRIDRIRPLATEKTGVIPHNVHYFDGYLVISWYTDGVVVVDVSQPDHMIKVGQYDTYLPTAGGFNGCWGAYPWLPSGLLLASDINSGLYIFQPNYIRAARLKGQVRDAISGQVLSDVRVEILDAQANARPTDGQGRYKTGIAAAGSREVVFTRPGYKEYRTFLTFENGETLTLDVALEPIPRIKLEGQVVAKTTGSKLAGAFVAVYSQEGELLSQADDEGAFTLEPTGGPIEIIVGKWGYKYLVQSLEGTEEQYDLMFELEEGYEDDFVFDYGWEVTGTATRGNWERGVPEATFLNNLPSNPGNAFPQALGNRCYVTGLAGGNAGDFDLDEGTAILTSPPMDLSQVSSATLSFAYWFFNDGGFGNPNDTLIMKVTNGEQEVEIGRITGRQNVWTVTDPVIQLNEVITLNDEVRVVFETSDLPNSGHIVEAAVDYFKVDFIRTTATQSLTANKSWEAFPNPTEGMLYIRGEFDISVHWRVLNGLGVMSASGQLGSGHGVQSIGLNGLAPGIYFLQLAGPDGTLLGVQKIHVLN
jgi:choice-of-anchor B domain-containing protein